MLNVYFEFRKGIFFVRLIGEMNSQNSLEKEKEIETILLENKFKYVVINVNNLKVIDSDGINYFDNICRIIKQNKSILVLCDKFNLLNKLTNKCILSIDDEMEVL